MKALVIGGSGFIGSWVVEELLSNEIEVSILCRSNNPCCSNDHQKKICYKGDCHDLNALRKAMNGCDAVYHVGGYYPVYSLNREEQARIALDELRNIISAVRECGVKKFIYTSGPSVLASDDEALKRSTYHYIKYIQHQEVLRAIENGLPAVIVIPGACFGPGDWKPTTGRLILEIASHRMWFYVEGKISPVDARDVAKAMVALLNLDSIGACYELTSWNCMISEFASLVAHITDVPPPRINVPYQISKVFSTSLEFIEYHIGKRRPYLPQSGIDLARFSAFLDSSKAVKDLGFNPRPIEDTIRDTLRWFRVNNYLPEKKIFKPQTFTHVRPCMMH